MKTRFYPLFVVLALMLALIVAPVAAQDGTVVDEPPVAVEVEDGDAVIPVGMAHELWSSMTAELGRILIITIVLMGVVVLGINSPALYYVYHSVPDSFRPMVREGALGIYRSAETHVEVKTAEAAANDVDWDDAGWAWLGEQLKTNRAKLERVLADETPPAPPPNPA